MRNLPHLKKIKSTHQPQKKENILQKRKKQFFEKKHSRETLMKQKSALQNKMWFFDTAAPIPGVSFLKKQKKFYREKMYAYKTFRNYVIELVKSVENNTRAGEPEKKKPKEKGFFFNPIPNPEELF